jgi:hypothetical protein
MKSNKKNIFLVIVLVCLSLLLSLFFFLKKAELVKIKCENFCLIYPDTWKHKIRPGPENYPWHLFFIKSKRNMRDQPTINIYQFGKKPTLKALSNYSSPIKLRNNYYVYDFSTVISNVKTPFVTFNRLINNNSTWIKFKYVTYTRDDKFKSFDELPADVKHIADSIQIKRKN